MKSYIDELRELPLQRRLYLKDYVPIKTLPMTVGVGKSRLLRKTAVNFLNRTKYEGCAVIATDRHDLNVEQVAAFYRENKDTALVARIWRGHGAEDPEADVSDEEIEEHDIATGDSGRVLMCWRNDEAEEVNACGFSIEHSLCKQLDQETKKEICCPFYDRCGFQRQKLPANLWFCSHESIVHGVPEIFGKVLTIMIDEDPLDAFFFGIGKKYEVALDALTDVEKLTTDDPIKRKSLIEKHLALHETLVKLPDGPVPVKVLDQFSSEALEISRLEWESKVADVGLRPDMSKSMVRGCLADAAHNKTVIKLTTMWRLIAKSARTSWRITESGKAVYTIGGAPDSVYSGWIELARDKDHVRVVQMKGTREPAAGWRQQTLITSATLDPELLRHIWDQKEDERFEFIEMTPVQVRRPKHVKVLQTLDTSFSKTWSCPEDAAERRKRSHEIYAMVLREAAKFAPQKSLLIMHMTNEVEIRKHFHVPPWLEIAHHGAVTGRDVWKNVRAVFIVGRAMPSAEIITQQAEALTGQYIAQRSYIQGETSIECEPDYVATFDSFVHPDPIGQRLLHCVMWASVLQAAGRARYIRRTASDPLDIWLLNDVSVPELGRVIEVKGADIAATLDDLMMATGCWLENAADAAKIHKGLITSRNALKLDRSRNKGDTPYKELLTRGADGFQVVNYRRNVPKTKKTRAILLQGLTGNPKKWLEAKVGELAEFQIL